MGDVAAKIRIMPESTDIDLAELKAALKNAIPDYARLHAMEERPIAFGLKAIVMAVILDKNVAGTEGIEAILASVKGVESVEVEEVGLL